LRVVAEDDRGVTINGLKMLGTATVFCHETWCGNLQPVAPGQEKETITCAVPLNAPGVSIWSRKPYERHARSNFDSPLAARFDENDAAVLFENVHVPWEHVFCHDNVEMTRAIYMRTPGHAMANHQATVRFLEKLKFIVGVAAKIVDMNGAAQVPAVQFTLGRLAAMQATLEGLIMGAINCGEAQTPPFHTVNRRYVYAALHWCTNNHADICDTVRELMGAGVFQMPADASVLDDRALREKFEAYWSTPGLPAKDRMKLLNLAWDLLGSEFAMRHDQYEKFYVGPSFVVRNYNFMNAPWTELEGLVDGIIAESNAMS
jgi:4-hydroxyphenylacetate 3-monooxygenase